MFAQGTKQGLTLETAYGFGLFYADGSCGLRKSSIYAGAFWRITNWKLDCLGRTKEAFEQQWCDMVFPIRIYDDYRIGSATNYGKRKRNLYCLEVAPKERHNDGSRGKFIEGFRAISYNQIKDKDVPAYIFEGSVVDKVAFLDGVIDGDGTRHSSKTGIIHCHGMAQVSKLIILMSSCGWYYHYWKDNGKDNYCLYYNRILEGVSDRLRS